MHQRKHRVAEQHSRTGVAHDGAHLLAHCGFVAVDGAIGAGRFVVVEAAFFDALNGVVEEKRALGARATAAGMVLSAVQLDHHADGAFFAFEAVVSGWHGAAASSRRSKKRESTDYTDEHRNRGAVVPLVLCVNL
jgi:hypothetical protein